MFARGYSRFQSIGNRSGDWGNRWSIGGAAYDLDFANRRYVGCTESDLVTARAMEAWVPQADGSFVNVGQNAPKIATGRGILIEKARTNRVTNGRGEPTASPSVQPTTWQQTGGLNFQYSRGTEFGLPYVRIVVTGTALTTRSGLIFNTDASTSSSDVWAWGMWARLEEVASLPNAFRAYAEMTDFGDPLTDTVSAPLTINYTLTDLRASLSMFSTVTGVSPGIVWDTTIGVEYDFTIRLYSPMFVLDTFTGSPILNAVGVTASAITQPADVVYLPISGIGTEYTLYGETPVLAPHVASGALIEAWASSADRARIAVSQTTNGGTIVSANASRSMITLSAGSGVARKFACRMVGGDTRYAVNGALSTVDTGAAPVVAPIRAYIGAGNAGTTGWLNDFLPRAAIIPRALSNAELQAITAA